jgi:mannan endo-1,4-beta-mannosidase
MQKSKVFTKTLAACSLALCALSASAGIYVSGDTVYEGNGNAFVMRGVNVAHAWYSDKTNSSLSDIAKTGANSVRVVLASGKLWSKTPASEVSSIISQAKANKLIAVLEVHDTTGLGEQTAATLSEAVDYWISIKSTLLGQEDYVIINIGNEPMGNGQTAAAWTNGHKDAITRLRAAGFKHSIMVDAANWGQDWQNIMRDNASSVLAADPQKNVIFSVHMYQVYNSDSIISNYMSAFKSNGLALVVGEFAADHFSENVDEASIMKRAQENKYGYLGWSWSGNGANLGALDIAQNFNPSSLTTWGNTLINGANGIKATSKLATIYTGGGTAASSSPAASSKPASSASSATTTTGGTCNWYGTSYPICTSTTSAWGYENNQSCVGRTSCAALPSPYGVAGSTSAPSSIAASSKPASSIPASSKPASSTPASSKPASSAVAASATCNWYGTPYPMCTTTTSGWGWENNKSCIAPSTCRAQ